MAASASTGKKTLVHCLLDLKKRGNSQPAVVYKKNGQWVEKSWQEYYQTVEEIAAGLVSLGLKRGDKLAIASNTRVEWSWVDMAAMAVGGIVIPIYPSNTVEDVKYILNNSETKFFIGEDQLQWSKWQQIKNDCPSVEAFLTIDDAEGAEAVRFEELLNKGREYLKENPTLLVDEINKGETEDTITILYTSGTTGLPKGVVLTNEQAISELDDVFAALQVTTEDRNMAFLPFSHILGRVESWANPYIGFTTAYAESIEKIKANLGETAPTFLIAVPRIFEKIYNGVLSQAEISPVKHKIFKWALSVGQKVSQCKLNKKPVPLFIIPQYKLAHKLVFQKLHKGLGGRLKFALSGSAPLSKEIAEFFHAAGILVLEGYGLTETTAGIFVNTQYDYQFGNVGKPIGDVQVKIADDGEILVKSKKIMKEYYKNPEATKETIVDGWFHTGDIGELSPDKRLKITDRKKDLIKTAGGKYVAPQKLENLLKLNNLVSNVLIHGDQKKYIVALVTLDPDATKQFAEKQDLSYTDWESLTQHKDVHSTIRNAVADVNNQLASYETIKNFAVLDRDFTIEDGELTPSLKVKRKVCDQKYQSTIDGLYGLDRSSI